MRPAWGRRWWLQERRRRAEVERRLEAIGRECSNVRLQLRRLGVK